MCFPQKKKNGQLAPSLYRTKEPSIRRDVFSADPCSRLVTVSQCTLEDGYVHRNRDPLWKHVDYMES